MAVTINTADGMEVTTPYLDFYGRCIWVIEDDSDIVQIVVASREGEHEGVRKSAYNAMRNVALRHKKFVSLAPFPLWIDLDDRKYYDGVSIWGATVFSGDPVRDDGWFERLNTWFQSLFDSLFD